MAPDNGIAHYRLARAYRKLGRTEDAKHELTTFRKLRDSHMAAQSLYQQVQERTVPRQTLSSEELQ